MVIISPSKFISVYSSDTEKYRQSFEIFLKYTNQKIQAKQKLDRLIKNLPEKKVFIDAGAGNGEITSRYSSILSEIRFENIPMTTPPPPPFPPPCPPDPLLILCQK